MSLRLDLPLQELIAMEAAPALQMDQVGREEGTWLERHTGPDRTNGAPSSALWLRACLSMPRPRVGERGSD
jgi:hypothetical protein